MLGGDRVLCHASGSSPLGPLKTVCWNLLMGIVDHGSVLHYGLEEAFVAVKLKVDIGEAASDVSVHERYWAIQRSWFARVNALCNLSCKKSREVAAHFRADF